MSKNSVEFYLKAIKFYQEKAKFVGFDLFNESSNLVNWKSVLVVMNFLLNFFIITNHAVGSSNFEEFVLCIVNYGYPIHAS
jgi:hypothetical protein